MWFSEWNCIGIRLVPGWHSGLTHITFYIDRLSWFLFQTLRFKLKRTAFFQRLNKVRCWKDTAGGVNQKDWKIRECSAQIDHDATKVHILVQEELAHHVAVQSNISNETKSDVTYYTVWNTTRVSEQKYTGFNVRFHKK